MSIVASALGGNADAATPNATSWEAAGQFSSTVNAPQSLWQYGWKVGPLNPLFNHFTFNMAPGTQNTVRGWQMTAPLHAIPVVMQNQKTVPNAAMGSTNNMPARGLIIHPGANGEAAAVRFKAPQAAQYRVSGQFYAGDATPLSGTNTLVSLVSTLPSTLAPTVRWSGAVNAATAPQASFTSTYVMLGAGDSLDFVVEAGPGNAFGNASTGLHAVIEIAGCYRGAFDPPCDHE